MKTCNKKFLNEYNFHPERRYVSKYVARKEADAKILNVVCIIFEIIGAFIG